MRSTLTRLLLFLLFGFFNCVALVNAQTGETQTDDRQLAPAVEAAKLGAAVNVHRAGNLYFSGKFSEADIQAMASSKIARVISLCREGEFDWDEAAAMKAADIEFLSVPIGKPETMTDEVILQVRKLLADDSKPTLLHCKSACRVGGVWLAYRVLDQKVSVKTAIEEAREVGLCVPAYEEKVLAYVRRQQLQESVKPGINDNFKSKDLDVESYIQRFEVESREIYLGREAIMKAADIKAGEVVADIGAGTGLFTRLFADKVGGDGWVYAVDISTKFLEHINQETAKLGLDNVTGVLCSDDSACLPPNSVDVVFICDTYHHFEFPAATMKSIRRALRKDGRLIMIDFERIEGKSRPWLMGHVRAGKEVFRAEIQDAGFKLVDEVKIKEFKENYFLIFKPIKE